jgi:gamma-aminobutyric acid type B receptor
MFCRCIAGSQPVVNILVIVGCCLSLLAVPLFGLDQNYISPEIFSFLCPLKAWCLSVGFSSGYGGMFAKIWMVHRVNTNAKNSGKVIRG